MGTRIVLDTNVLISALGWNGAERALLAHCREGLFELVISLPLLKERERVHQYKKLFRRFFDPGPRVFEGQGPVEDGFFPGGVGIDREVAEALELDAVAD